MKLTYITVIEGLNALNYLANSELLYKTSLKVSKNLKALQDTVSEYQEEMNKLAEQYFEKDEAGQFVFIDENKTMLKVINGKVEEFNQKKKELDEFEVEVNIYTLTDSELENISIKPTLLSTIEFMIEHEDK